MYNWPSWVYYVWALFVRATLFPIVLPVRILEYLGVYRGL